MKTSDVNILARGAGHDKATCIAVLLSLGLWDRLSISDREAWCERAEIMDTDGGRLLFQTLDRMGAFGTTPKEAGISTEQVKESTATL